MGRRFAVIALLIACGQPVGTRECLVGLWLDFAFPCPNNQFCKGSVPAAECSFLDCVAQNATDYFADGGFQGLYLLRSPAQRQFSAPPPPTFGTWSASNGHYMSGRFEATFTCTATQLTLGEGPLAPRSTRADPEFAAAIRSAEASGQWTAVRY